MLRNLVFFGTESISLPTLQMLHESGWPIKYVVTKPDSESGRGKKITKPPVKVFAEKNNIEVLQPTRVADIEDSISSIEKPLGVLVAYGKIIPKSTLDIFEDGIINAHPSLLPRWRGASPIEQTILAGDSETAVSIMKLSEEMDAGPVYTQDVIQLNGDENRIYLTAELFQNAAELMDEYLPQIALGMNPRHQRESGVTLAPLLKKSDGDIDWNKTAVEIERQIRAYLGWPGSKSVIGKTKVTITSAEVIAGEGPAGMSYLDGDGLATYTKKDSLKILLLKPDGKNEMTAKQFLAGYPI